jgi:hypothetical protein
VVLIVSNAAILIGDPETLGGRPCSHGIFKMPHLPLPALAMTAATGVDPAVHGVVVSNVVHQADLTTGPVSHEDRHFPAFWNDAAKVGLRTLAIDWPATENDPDLPDAISPAIINTLVREADAIAPDRITDLLHRNADEDLRQPAAHFLSRLDVAFAAAHAAISAAAPPDLLALVLRGSNKPIPDAALSPPMRAALESFISSLPSTTPVLIVRRWVGGDDVANRRMPYAFTLVGGSQIEARKKAPELAIRAVGGAVRLFAGLPCPHGVMIPNWRFVKLPKLDANRPLPQGIRESQTDWGALVDRVHAMSDTPARGKAARCLTYRFAVLASIALIRQQWEELGSLAGWLVNLRGDLVDHWMHVYAINRRGESEALPAAVNAMTRAHPNQHVTSIANCLLRAKDAPGEIRSMLEPINAAELPISSALGTLGRLCLLAGLPEAGVDALRRAIQTGTACAVDRGALAAHLLEQGEPAAARLALGPLGGPNGAKQWCILRLRILLAMDLHDAAAKLAESILDRYPAESTVLQLMKRT